MSKKELRMWTVLVSTLAAIVLLLMIIEWIIAS